MLATSVSCVELARAPTAIDQQRQHGIGSVSGGSKPRFTGSIRVRARARSIAGSHAPAAPVPVRSQPAHAGRFARPNPLSRAAMPYAAYRTGCRRCWCRCRRAGRRRRRCRTESTACWRDRSCKRRRPGRRTSHRMSSTAGTGSPTGSFRGRTRRRSGRRQAGTAPSCCSWGTPCSWRRPGQHTRCTMRRRRRQCSRRPSARCRSGTPGRTPRTPCPCQTGPAGTCRACTRWTAPRQPCALRMRRCSCRWQSPGSRRRMWRR